ncbi:hypothetical protein LXA43DRAFT_1004925 [Ganoderma leucocontextum]|nr:hypothetical protein LXA43DRAFT_1004925 [Ganoderma leucocontextum]
MLGPLTRAEKIRILNTLGVDIPADTKLLDNILEKRLCDALDAVQYKDRLPASMDLKALRPWPTVEPGEGGTTSTRPRPLAKAVQRRILDDARQAGPSLPAAESEEAMAFGNPFEDLRRTMRAIARVLDKGGRWCLLRGDEDKSGIMLRFVAILEVNKNLPVFVVLYRAADQGTQRSTENWVLEQLKTDLPSSNPALFNMSASSLEQKMILKILKQNAPLVPTDYEATRQPLEQQFKVSVLIPVGPLEYEALSKLNNNMGCSVCGRSGGYRCKDCQSVSYCSPECQRTDWSDHKAACRSLKDATWRTVCLSAASPGMENTTLTLLNRHTSMSLPGARGSSPMTKQFVLSDRLVHADAYGGGLFLAKMQLQTAAPRGRGHILIYDRRMTFVAFLREDKDREAFREFVEELKGPRGYMGVRMHRWVKRTGDWELSVCLDREPATDVKW